MNLKGNVIYAVDCDAALSFGRFPEVGEPNENVFRLSKVVPAGFNLKKESGE